VGRQLLVDSPAVPDNSVRYSVWSCHIDKIIRGNTLRFTAMYRQFATLRKPFDMIFISPYQLIALAQLGAGHSSSLLPYSQSEGFKMQSTVSGDIDSVDFCQKLSVYRVQRNLLLQLVSAAD